jgi:hypothetical protein
MNVVSLHQNADIFNVHCNPLISHADNGTKLVSSNDQTLPIKSYLFKKPIYQTLLKAFQRFSSTLLRIRFFRILKQSCTRSSNGNTANLITQV